MHEVEGNKNISSVAILLLLSCATQNFVTSPIRWTVCCTSYSSILIVSVKVHRKFIDIKKNILYQFTIKTNHNCITKLQIIVTETHENVLMRIVVYQQMYNDGRTNQIEGLAPEHE